MNFRIRSRTDDDGTYWWIEEKITFFWWQYEPGYHLSKEQAERRLQKILDELNNERKTNIRRMA